MNLRNARRSLGRLARSLAVPDHAVAPPNSPFVLFSCHDADRSMLEAGKRYSPLLESIRQIYAELDYESLNLTHPYAAFNGRMIKDQSITLNYRSLKDRAALLVGRFMRSRTPTARVDLEMALYHQLLSRLRPEIIVAIQPPLGMCQAARKLGIGVIEPMHATQLSLSDKIFGAHMHSPDQSLPHVILTFDEVSQATLTTLCAGRDIVPIRGSDPWTHSLRMTKSRSTAAAVTHGPSVPRPKQVLVTLQWGYDGERDTLSNIIPNGILHPQLEAAFADPRNWDVRFLVRMHPIQMTKPGYRHHRRYIEALAARLLNVECAQASSRPMPLLLDEVDAHITMSSASVGNAADASVPSLMLCPTLHEGGAHYGFFRELEGSGLVTFGTLDSAAITSWIVARPRRSAPSANDAEQRHGEELKFYALLMKTAKVAAARPGLDEVAA